MGLRTDSRYAPGKCFLLSTGRDVERKKKEKEKEEKSPNASRDLSSRNLPRRDAHEVPPPGWSLYFSELLLSS